MEGDSLLKLSAWLSPAFPTGAFAYSGGLEHAIDQQWVCDRGSLARWLEDVLTKGSLRNDAIFLSCAWRAFAAQDHAAFASTRNLAAAFSPSHERHNETMALGQAFVKTVNSAWPSGKPALSEFLPYPVAIGTAAAAHNIALRDTLTVFLQAGVGNLISVGIRLIPLGQTDGQRVLASLGDHIGALSRDAFDASLDDVGGCTLLSDFACLAHETMDTRLFRS